MSTMEMSQMCGQAMWDRDSALMQIPSFTPECVKAAGELGIKTIFDFMDAMGEDSTRIHLLQRTSITESQLGKIAHFTSSSAVSLTPLGKTLTFNHYLHVEYFQQQTNTLVITSLHSPPNIDLNFDVCQSPAVGGREQEAERELELRLKEDKLIEELELDFKERDAEIGLFDVKFQLLDPLIPLVEAKFQTGFTVVEKRLRRERARARNKDLNRKQREAAIVAAVVFKAAYRKAGNGEMMPGDRVKTIKGLQEKPEKFGCQTSEEVDALADAWPRVIDDRNATAHQVRGDVVVAAVQHCPKDVREISTRVLEFLWETPVEKWHTTNPKLKDRTIEA
ncbi:hypothetical protein B9Z19DRAFT_1130523 [Tuber borchii]|uniref:Uncharacterized protein n=1 Tax=Tuber borchii TaxID=42251 RepID=A0A2T6ZK83_TUBBO|nr:hypothetical protein B9Z19DRAFT_1130523 [Tuber borchii]